MRLNDLVARSVDPRPVAITRAGVGIAALILAFADHDNVRSLLEPGALLVPFADWLPDPSRALGDVVYVVWTAAAVALILGWHARVAAVVVAASGALTMSLDQHLYSNHLTLMIVIALLLSLGRPAAAWSLDARRAGVTPASVPYWPQWLLMVQISTVYGFTAISKINGSWLAGEVLDNQIREPLSDLPIDLLAAAAAATIGVEMFLAVALWRDRLRPWAFAVGLGLHVGITIGMPDPEQLVPFGFMMLSSYILFLKWSPAERRVIWDDHCSFCSASVARLRRLDAFGVHRFVGSSDSSAFEDVPVTREQADEAVQLVEHGRRSEGFDAIRLILEKCPATFLAAPVLRIPPAPAIGRRVYRRVAARRTCRVPAHQDAVAD
jgi:predicted DCC family thiol-disulfide oxidoreductase YuxK